jgi:RNA polymerase sigma factor (sigma-70 family)
LPAEEQEVINMLFYEGFNQEETAEFLGISLSTVKRRWHAARLKLAETF